MDVRRGCQYITARTVADFVEDIRKAISSIESLTVGIGSAEFSQDREKVFAVERAIAIIGEAVKNVPDSLRSKYPDIPWKSIAGMRDKLVHEYWATNQEVIWKSVREDVPKLKVALAQLSEGISRVMEELSIDE